MERGGMNHIPSPDLHHCLHFRNTTGQSEWGLGLIFEFCSLLEGNRLCRVWRVEKRYSDLCHSNGGCVCGILLIQ